MFAGEVSGAMSKGAARIPSQCQWSPTTSTSRISNFGRLAFKGEKYSIDADSVFIHKFFAQVKAETDPNKKAKQLYFLKPPSDYL